MNEHLRAEISVMIGQLTLFAEKESTAASLTHLRREAEDGAASLLGDVVGNALGFVDLLCWESLSSGDVTAFGDTAYLGRELFDFAVSARLLG